MCTPIFVLGLQRSGTTWLANQISKHSRVAAVRDERGNVFESVYFSHIMGRYGNLAESPNYSELVSVLSNSRYFHLCGISKESFFSYYPTDYVRLFQDIMRDLARREGATHWLEKSPHHTLIAHELRQKFPAAKFVAIVRDPIDRVSSHLKLDERPALSNLRKSLLDRRRYLIRGGLHEAACRRFLQRFSQATGTPIVTYEELARDPNEVLRKVCDALGLEYEEDLVVPAAPARSSYSGGGMQGTVLTVGERRLFVAAYRSASAMPLGWLTAYFDPRPRNKRQARPLPSWFFGGNFRCQ